MTRPASPRKPGATDIAPRGRGLLAGVLLGAALIIGAGGWALLGGSRTAAPAQRQPLGLFTSLPILWAEAPDIAGMLAADAPPHWARTALENRYRVTPLNTLAPPADVKLLLAAQPRALTPDENVALDGWVRGGGKVLVFADPLLTWDSRFAPGDRRRPQDTVLISPILARWGLGLAFDEGQPPGERDVAGIPVNLPGTLTLRPGGFESRCTIGEAGLIARCAIGKGRAVIVADAAVLEPGEADRPSEERRAKALEVLADWAFAV